MLRRSRTPAFHYGMPDQGGLADSHISSLRNESVIEAVSSWRICGSHRIVSNYTLSVDFNVRQFTEQTYKYHVLQIET